LRDQRSAGSQSYNVTKLRDVVSALSRDLEDMRSVGVEADQGHKYFRYISKEICGIRYLWDQRSA
jgi:hypothetical protein